jgi:hypothetical protein
VQSLPSYLSTEAWSEFVKMRTRIKKPLTDYAARLLLKRLQAIKDAGHCPNAALDQSTVNCWAGVWPAREDKIESAAPMVQTANQWLAEREKHAAESTPPPESIRKLAQKLRRIA